MLNKESIGTLWASDAKLYVTIDDIVMYNYTKISYAGETYHNNQRHVIFFYEGDFGKETCSLEENTFLQTYKPVKEMSNLQLLEKIYTQSQSY